MACRGTPKISMESQYKEIGNADVGRISAEARIRRADVTRAIRRMRRCAYPPYDACGYDNDYFQAAHLVSALVA